MKAADFQTQLDINGYAEIDGTKITVNGVQGITEEEARAYLKMIREQYPQDIVTSLDLVMPMMEMLTSRTI